MKKIYVLLSFILLTGFFLRLFPLRTGVRDWDETVYLQDAERVAGQDSSNYTELDFRPPMLSLIGGAVFALGGTVEIFQILLAFLSTLTVFMVYKMGEQLFSARTGIISALIASVSFLHVRLSHDIMVDPVLPLFWLVSAYFLFKHLEAEDEGKEIFISGFFAGIAVLTKFTSLVVLAAGVFILWNYSDNFYRDSGKYMTAFSFSVLPYLIWNIFAFGNPLYSFLKGFELSGATDPWTTYLTGFWKLVPLPFLAVSIFSYREKDDALSKITMVLTYFFALYIPLQLFVANKELRFLLPAMPFISVVAGRQVTRIFGNGRKFWVWMVVLFSLSVVPLAVSDEVKTVGNGVFFLEEESAMHDASLWMKENTDENSVVYTNFEWPIIAYYSGRDIKLLPVERRFESYFEIYMDKPGYVVYQDYSPSSDFRKEFLGQDPRFTLNRSFSSSVYIYYYGGSRE